MLLIPDNETLSRFIPNTIAPAVGEKPIYIKILPFLTAAEDWLEFNFIDRKILNEIIQDATDEEDPFYFLPRRIVALRAWINAVPSIDIIVSSVGVGVVETNALKPASKAKIENLINATKDELDYNIESLINRIYRIPRWLDTRQADKFRSSLFPDFAILDALDIKKNRYEEWLVYINRASLIERRIAREWISAPVLARLRAASVSRSSDGAIKEVLDLTRAAVIEELRSGIEQKTMLEDITEIIRTDKTNFADWHTSDTASRFHPVKFENKEDKGGYWL